MNRNELLILNQTELFKPFNLNEIQTIFRTKDYSTAYYRKGNIIHFEREVCCTFDVILEGEVYIQKIDENGNVLTVAEFRKGDNLGGNLLFSKNPYYPMMIIAKSNVKILKIKKSFILDLCQKQRKFLQQFLICISDKTTILTDKINTISMKSIREFLIDYLNYEYLNQNNKKILLKMTKKELAEQLGIQRTSLSRELNKMKKEGLVDYDAHSITIQDSSIIKKY